jgi:hypothetical protein
MAIVARGTRVQVAVNGREVINADVADYPHKVESHPGLLRERGYIGLQNHGSRVEFRNIRIRELADG